MLFDALEFVEEITPCIYGLTGWMDGQKVEELLIIHQPARVQQIFVCMRRIGCVEMGGVRVNNQFFLL
jgi:hypothetical protein